MRTAGASTVVTITDNGGAALATLGFGGASSVVVGVGGATATIPITGTLTNTWSYIYATIKKTGPNSSIVCVSYDPGAADYTDCATVADVYVGAANNKLEVSGVDTTVRYVDLYNAPMTI